MKWTYVVLVLVALALGVQAAPWYIPPFMAGDTRCESLGDEQTCTADCSCMWSDPSAAAAANGSVAQCVSIRSDCPEGATCWGLAECRDPVENALVMLAIGALFGAVLCCLVGCGCCCCLAFVLLCCSGSAGGGSAGVWCLRGCGVRRVLGRIPGCGCLRPEVVGDPDAPREPGIDYDSLEEEDDF